MKAVVQKQCESRDELLCQLIDELVRSCETIALVEDGVYCQTINGSSVGAQFRHNLDFVASLFPGIETGRIDHSTRERDPFVEIDREYAIRRFEDVIARLRRVDKRWLGKSVLVRSEIDESSWLPSSIAREVEFIYSHTIHHHALIAEKLASLGSPSLKELGVAPSTLRYRAADAA